MLLLREARAACGLSRPALASRAGISVSTVRRLERGMTRPRPHVARRLGSALGIDPRQVTELRSGVRELTRRAGTVRPRGLAG